MQIYKIQGDVVFVKVSEIPKDALRRPIKKLDDLIIQHGESGNVHVLVPKGSCFNSLKSDVREQLDTPSLFEMTFSHIELYDKDGILYVRAKEDVDVEHTGIGENHKVQTLEKNGEYVVERQKEKDWFANEVRSVKD